MADIRNLLDLLAAHAGAFAGWTASAGAILVVAAAVVAVRAWMAARRALTAASSLVGVHLDALTDRIDQAAAAATPLPGHGERLAGAAESLGGSLGDLRTLLAAPGTERRRMLRRIADVVLPTDDDANGRMTSA